MRETPDRLGFCCCLDLGKLEDINREGVWFLLAFGELEEYESGEEMDRVEMTGRESKLQSDIRLVMDQKAPRYYTKETVDVVLCLQMHLNEQGCEKDVDEFWDFVDEQEAAYARSQEPRRWDLLERGICKGARGRILMPEMLETPRMQRTIGQGRKRARKNAAVKEM